MSAPAFLLHGETWGLVLTFLALAMTPGILGALAMVGRLGKPEARPEALTLIGALTASGAVGAALGVSSAMSRTPVTDALIGGVLTLLGGVAVYFLGVKREGAGAVCAAVAALALTLLVGEIWGAAQRGIIETRARCVARLTDPAYSQSAIPADTRRELMAHCAPYFRRAGSEPGSRAAN